VVFYDLDRQDLRLTLSHLVLSAKSLAGGLLRMYGLRS
jgi:hypothetical protein